VQARYSRDGGVINGGLNWRVYADKPDQNGVFRLLKEDSTPQPTFVLLAQLHHARGLWARQRGEACSDFGCAGARNLEIPGGGLRIEGRRRQRQDSDPQISFEHLQGSQFERASGVRSPPAS